MSSMASFDIETIESDLEETQRRYSKTPSSTMPTNASNSLMSSPSGEDDSPIKGKMSTQKRRTGGIVDRQPHDRKGLSIGLLKRVRNFRTFILQNPQYREETRKWSSKSKPYNRLEELNVLAAYDYNLKEGRLYRQSKPFEGDVSSDLFDATSLFREWSVIQRALSAAWKNKLFPSELQKSDIESSEEENSDHGDASLSTNPEPVRPEPRLRQK
ncbi:unnamed protein product [Fusarium langsethiae]|nr:unnamed protein product [Fusarium langsethiae]